MKTEKVFLGSASVPALWCQAAKRELPIFTLFIVNFYYYYSFYDLNSD